LRPPRPKGKKKQQPIQHGLFNPTYKEEPINPTRSFSNFQTNFNSRNPTVRNSFLDITREQLREKLGESWLGETRMGDLEKKRGDSMQCD